MSAIPLRKLEGKYDILEKFREGGMGAIYKVRHRLLDEVRVIKVMRPHLGQDEELKGRFLREARLAIKLRHPNIAHLYDFTVDDDGTAYIVMEFINGITVEDMLKGMGPPRLGLSLEIAQQSLRALGYLHDKGMIHRDIAPDNLMLTEDTDGNPLMKLIDLGIAKSLAGGEGQGTATGIYLGKVRYSSPEQFRLEGAAPMDSRGDLYSFGIVLYELLTGRYPIQGLDPSSIIAGHLFRPPLDFAETDPEGRVPPSLRQLVLASLAKSPAERPQSAQEFSRGLAAFRQPSDFTRTDLEQALSRSADGAAPAEPPPGTTTQDRLDEQFGMMRTPPPQRLAASPGSPAAPRVVVPLRRAEIAAALAEIEGALTRGDYRGAETLLYAAEASFGTQEDFPALYERLAELRRRDLAAKAAAHVTSARRRLAAEDFAGALGELRRARELNAEDAAIPALIAEAEAGAQRQEVKERRAKRLAAAAAKIQEHLDTGDLEKAGNLLDRAVAAFGAAEVLREKWQRLEELRRRAGRPA